MKVCNFRERGMFLLLVNYVVHLSGFKNVTCKWLVLTSEITDEVSFGQRDQHLHLGPQMKQLWYSALLTGTSRGLNTGNVMIAAQRSDSQSNALTRSAIPAVSRQWYPVCHFPVGSNCFKLARKMCSSVPITAVVGVLYLFQILPIKETIIIVMTATELHLPCTPHQVVSWLCLHRYPQPHE